MVMENYINLNKITPFLDSLRNGEHNLLLTLGDSLTCNAHFTGAYKGHPELLHSQLRIHYKTQKILLLNSGISGNTCGDVLARFDSDVSRFRPNLTLVCLGANDTKKSTPKEFEKNLNTIIDKLQELGSIVVLRSPTPIMEYEPKPEHIWKEEGDIKQKDIVEITRSIAEKRVLAFIDIYSIWKEMEESGMLHIGSLMHDEVHPNGAGHQLVCRNLAKAFGMPALLYFEKEN